MNASGRAALPLALGIAACFAARADVDEDVATLAAWWPGIYDSSEQLIVAGDEDETTASDLAEVRVHTLVSRVPLDWLGEHVLYAEEFRHDDPEHLRRQVLLRLEPDRASGGVRVAQFTLREPARFRHLYRSPGDLARLRLADLESNPGCDLVLRREVAQFAGGTEGNACRDDAAEDARYVDYRVLIGEDLYWYRKRYFRVFDNALLREVAGYTWFQLYDARLYSCRVQWAAADPDGPRRDIGAFDVHDQGGKVRVTLPDGRRLQLELHGQNWPFSAGRDALILIVSEEGGEAPLATAWANIDADAISAELGWMAVRCAAVVPRDRAVEG
jgi:hypothetical protein